MATPIMQKTGATSGASPGGKGTNDLVPGEKVDLADLEVANLLSTYFWEFEDYPIGTSPTITNPTTATPHFYVDADPALAGSYVVRCTVDGLYSSVEIYAKPLTYTGARIPSYLEKTEYDGNGNTKGWHEAVTTFMRAFDADTSSVAVTALSISAAAVAINLSSGNFYTLELTENCELSNVVAAPTGRAQQFQIRVVQDATGGWVLTYDTGYTVLSGTVNTDPLAVSYLSCIAIAGGVDVVALAQE